MTELAPKDLDLVLAVAASGVVDLYDGSKVIVLAGLLNDRGRSASFALVNADGDGFGR